MFKLLLKTPSDFAILLVRLGLGVSLLPHGLGKLGLFGGSTEGAFKTLETSAADIAQQIGGSPWMGYVAIAVAVAGSVSLIIGFLGRVWALLVGALLAATAWTVGGLEAGTYLEWWRQTAESHAYGSYHLIGLLCALAILIRGSGALSVDRIASRPSD